MIRDTAAFYSMDVPELNSALGAYECVAKWTDRGKEEGTPLCRRPLIVLPDSVACYRVATALRPACSARVVALSVASQVNSGSLRPKCP
jgi:hypothetical protein